MNLEDKIILFLACILVSLSVSFCSGSFTCRESGYSTGHITLNTDTQWRDGDRITSVWGVTDGYYHEGAAASQAVTNGYSELDTTTELGGAYTSDKSLIFKQGAVWDTLATNSLIPNESELACTASEVAYTGTEIVSGSTPDHEWAVGQTGAMGSNGRYESDQFNAEQDFAISAKYGGNGSVYGDLMFGAESGTDKDSNVQNYETWAQRHVLFTSDSQVGGIIDWSGSDWFDPLNLTANETQTNTTSEVANVTEEV